MSSLIAFLLYVFYLLGPLSTLVTAVTAIVDGLAAETRLGEVEAMAVEDDVDPELDEDEPGVPGWPAHGERPPRIDVEQVRFGYPGREPVLCGLDFTAPAARRTVLVGPSGAGKSTVFALLARSHEPHAGRILLDGHDIATLPRNVVRRRIGLVEQDAPVLDGTLAENLRYGAPRAGAAEVAEVLRLTRLDDLVARLPHGLDTEVGPRGVGLSGGERQRLSIARALLRRPRILLMDEATSQLDARNEAALRDVVADVVDRCTVLLIAHRVTTIASADRVVVVDAGRVRAVGSHEDLLVTDAAYGDLVAAAVADHGPR